MKYIFFILSSLLLILSNFETNINQTSKSYVLDLNYEINDSVNLQVPMLNNFYFLKPLRKTPLLLNEVEKYKGIPKCDSLQFFYKYEEPIQKYYELYLDKKMEKNEFFNILQKVRVDTLALSKKNIQQGFITLIGFIKDKQIVIADFNRNRDFSDDVKYEFDIDFGENTSTKVINNLQKSDYEYQYNYGKEIISYKRKLVLFPQRQGSVPKTDNLAYLTRFLYKDYWKGQINVENLKYDIYYQGVTNDMGGVFIKPSDISFKNDNGYNGQFLYNLWDTIPLGKRRFVIDSINKSISKIYFNEIKKINDFGKNINDQMDSFEIYTINGEKDKLNDIIFSNEYTLLDFWGTWCGPCLKQTPLLKKFHSQYKSNVKLVSIAKDNKLDEVQKYVAKKQLNWSQYIVNDNFKSDIIEALNISYYPTLILLNKEAKIIYRGGDIEEVKKLIQ